MGGPDVAVFVAGVVDDGIVAQPGMPVLPGVA
jgi:hypothetical protein